MSFGIAIGMRQNYDAARSLELCAGPSLSLHTSSLVALCRQITFTKTAAGPHIRHPVNGYLTAPDAETHTEARGQAPTPADQDSSVQSQQARPEASHSSLALQPCLRKVEFLENLRNPRNLQPVSLPLQLKLFSRIPVVMSARLFGQTGKPSEIYARLLLA